MVKNHFSIPVLKDLYSITAKDYLRVCTMLGDAFRDDPIWSQILKDEPAKIQKAFGVPLKYTMKFGRVYAPSNEISAVALWLPAQFANMTLWRMILSGSLSVAMKLGSNIMKHIVSSFASIDKDRKHNMQGQYVYLSVLGVSPPQQGKGLGSSLVTTMINALPSDISISLETETEANVKFYERLGFQVIKEARVPVFDLPIWEMIYSRK